MNLRSVDLNLLVILDTLLRVRHVSRAAAHLGIGQPGMSAALGRLRHVFGDPLLVRQGADMVPTKRALSLQPQVSRILRDISNIVEPPEAFDPQTTEKVFRVRMSDLLSSLILPALMSRLTEVAPLVQLEISHFAPAETVDALERDVIDLAVSTDLDVPKSITISHLFDDPGVVCLARQGLDIADALKTPAAFAALPQIKVSQSPIDDRFADRQLAAKGLKRNTVLTVPHWLAVPEILKDSAVVAVMPASIAAKFGDRFDLKVHPIPFIEKGFEWSLYWHKRYANDPAHTWLREMLSAHCGRG